MENATTTHHRVGSFPAPSTPQVTDHGYPDPPATEIVHETGPANHVGRDRRVIAEHSLQIGDLKSSVMQWECNSGERYESCIADAPGFHAAAYTHSPDKAGKNHRSVSVHGVTKFTVEPGNKVRIETTTGTVIITTFPAR